MHRRLVPLVALLFLSIGPMFGQFDTGTILGSIHDASSAPVPSAVVVIEEVRKGIIHNARSSDAGTYEILSIPIGRYRLRVEQPGFRPQSSDEFELTIGARQRVDFKLELSTVQSSVQVNADVSILQSDTSDRGQTIAAAQIRELPLAGRAYSELIYLSTGIVRTPSSGVGSAQREASFSVNGLRSTANNFLLDGLDNNYFGTSNQGFSNQVVQPPPDAVAEFRVITNNWSAEYGRAGGATVNASLRSGTNQFHGAAWEFFRNTQLNAVGFFKPTTGQPIQNQNQFGGAFGGPVIRNHTFFFADYEGYREVNSSVAYATLPNDAQRSGSLGVPVRNPITGDVYTDGVIPKSAVIPYARAILDSLPANTGTGAANNYQSLRRTELVAGVKFMTIRSDKFDKFAQPNVGYDGPELKGADNVVLANLDHREVAFHPLAFAEMYRFLTGHPPRTRKPAAVSLPVISGILTSVEGLAPTNRPLPGVRFRVFALKPGSAVRDGDALLDITTSESGAWGPLPVKTDTGYEFVLAKDGRSVAYFMSGIVRSTALLNFRFLPVPATQALSGQTPSGPRLLIHRPQGYSPRTEIRCWWMEPRWIPCLLEFLPATPSAFPLRPAAPACASNCEPKLYTPDPPSRRMSSTSSSSFGISETCHHPPVRCAPQQTWSGAWITARNVL